MYISVYCEVTIAMCLILVRCIITHVWAEEDEGVVVEVFLLKLVYDLTNHVVHTRNQAWKAANNSYIFTNNINDINNIMCILLIVNIVN